MALFERRFGRAIALSFSACGALFVRSAAAQQQTFHLDRLEVPGAPDDGLVLMRPVTHRDATFFAQLGLGLAIDPLRMSNLSKDPAVLRASPANLITTQLSTYVSAGVELFDRLTLGLTFPAAWIQAGNQPDYTRSLSNMGGVTAFSTTGPSLGDTRLDARYVLLRSEDRTKAVALQLSAWLPTGTGSSTNFGGDGGFGWMPLVAGEWTPPHFVTLVANTGVHFRPGNSINDPAGRSGNPQGLGVANEWRWAVGAFLPLGHDRYRVGATVFGQTGITNDNTVGDTVFTSQNTPVEWNVEGRMMQLPMVGGERFFVGAGLGTRILGGYGAPDFRLVALIGTYVPIEDTNPHSPDARIKSRRSLREALKDSDGDGIPDDVDACPTEPEDHKDPDPMDGCPAALDRDGDGIPDQYDKCPDDPEDKDGVDDQDGCPEVDADSDGIPDTQDACPKEPGQPDPDPKKNGCPRFIHLEGGQVRILQQVHFATGSATILPDSFPMLTEIVQLLKATPGIKRMRIEGHTDNRGGADLNLDLSKRRAASVRTWLIEHGIADSRLESDGYGLTRPIESNDTDAGRGANRRVEFKIIDED
ncbi:MAG: OmpA family protein [Myxococcota bacterium]|nr:OmpA family protein [Myxococcota bacterium]